jgi:hypothetical protein
VTQAPARQSDLEKARRQMMTGVMLVMGACVFGGLTAVVLVALGQRNAAAIVAALAGVIVVVGVFVQVLGFQKLKAGERSKAP